VTYWSNHDPVQEGQCCSPVRIARNCTWHTHTHTHTHTQKGEGGLLFVPTFVQHNSEMNACILILFSSPICMFIPVVCTNWLLIYTIFQENSVILQENVPRLNRIDINKNTSSKSRAIKEIMSQEKCDPLVIAHTLAV